MTDISTFTVRDARDSDAQDLLGLVTLCFAEYPGCFVDPHEDLVDFLKPASSFAGHGLFLVAEDEFGRVGGSAALTRGEDESAEMHRVYVRPDLRRFGLARMLVRRLEAAAADWRVRRIDLWSDTRFTAAHAFYTRLGYRQTGRERELGDISSSREWHFAKFLTD